MLFRFRLESEKGDKQDGEENRAVGKVGETGKNGKTGIHAGGMHFFRKKCIFVKLNKNLLIT